jgi:hypothetical protein
LAHDAASEIRNIAKAEDTDVVDVDASYTRSQVKFKFTHGTLSDESYIKDVVGASRVKHELSRRD